ncbi:MAG: dihydroorotate dehydrogenase [Ruminococcaceae bacterium]|nr:dihydroorotate dehydrogenase [Oscillospiraceae bacterium]
MKRLETSLSGITLQNPVIPASGTFGFGQEMAQFYDLNVLGGISLKGTTGAERFGNPTPRIAECREGLLNAVGLQNPGVDAVIAHELPAVRKLYNGVLLANISGFSVEEYVMVAEKFDRADEIDILEINISCPNVRHGGMAFGTDPGAAQEVTAAVKAVTHKPVYMKLSPNVTDIAAIARACEAGGADGITLINTLLGMVIDPRTGRPIVSTKMSGFSGPAIKPVALRMVYQAAQAVNIPIIGVGGISCADDVIEFMSAGASAVQVGAQNLVDPFACPKIIAELPGKLDEYGIANLKDIIGRSLTL